MVRYNPTFHPCFVLAVVLLRPLLFAAAGSEESQDHDHDAPSPHVHLSCEHSRPGVVGCSFEIPAEESEALPEVIMTYCFPPSEDASRRCIRLSVDHVVEVQGSWDEFFVPVPQQGSSDDVEAKEIDSPAVEGKETAGDAEAKDTSDDIEASGPSEPNVGPDSSEGADSNADAGEGVDSADAADVAQNTCGGEGGECSTDTPPPDPTLPVRLDETTGTLHIQVANGTNKYTSPFSVYSREVTESLNSFRRKLSQVPPSSRRNPSAYAEYVLTLADLSADLGLSHATMLFDVEDKFEREDSAVESSYSAERRDEVREASKVELEHGYVALGAALELYAIARSFGSDGGGGGGTLGVGVEASVSVHLAELAMHRKVPPDGGPDYKDALRHGRSAQILYREELDAKGGEDLDDEKGSDGDDELLSLELGTADSALRVGTILLEMYERGLIDMALGRDDVASISTTTSSASERPFGADEESVLLEAREKFETGASMYRRSLHSLERSRLSTFATKQELEENKASLADALHNVGVVSTYLSDLPRAIDAWEESFFIYNALVEQTRGEEDDEIALIMAETMQSLSDAYLQSGRYDEAVDRFKKAMQIYANLEARGIDKTGIKQPQRLQTDFDSDEAIELHKEALEQYRQSLTGDLPPEFENDLGGGEYLEQDDLYEADLLATLGSMHMSREEPNEAHEYLTKAIDLYEISAESDEPAHADALLNFAFTQVQLGNYEEGARSYERAIEIYRNTIPEGRNPFTFGDEDGMATSGLGGTKTRQGATGDNDGSNVQRRFIDIDAYQSGIKNATSKVGEV